MIEKFVEMLSLLDPAHLTTVFVYLAVAFCLFAVIEVARGGHQRYVQFAPTLLTTLGILGTFVGITIGLANFSVENRAAIDESIPRLLAGLKMAFITSIVGMALALLTRFLATFLYRTGDATPAAVGPEEILKVLQAQYGATVELRRAIAGEGDASVVTQLQKVRSDMQDGLRDTRRAIAGDGEGPITDKLQVLSGLVEAGNGHVAETRTLAKAIAETSEATRKAIAGEGDTSLVTQIQRLRTDLQDEMRQVREAVVGADGRSISAQMADANQAVQDALTAVRSDLRDFAEKVSELGSKALIEALSGVIRDFNQKITEQFGDNFKRLDDSVGKLVQWQDDYRQQMADMKAGLEAAVEAVQASRDALHAVRQDSEAIPPLIAKLEDVIGAAFVYLDDMERHLAAFAEVKERAVSAIPQIQGHLDRLMGEIEGAVKTSTQHQTALVENSDQLIQKFKSSTEILHERFVEQTTDMVDWITTHLKDTANEVATRNAEAGERLKVAGKALEDGMEGVKQRLVESIAKVDVVSTELGGKLQEAVGRAFNEQNSHIQQLSISLRKEIEEARGRHEELLSKEIAAIDQAMQAEINRVMQQMADSLIAITRKFVTDYGVLADATEQCLRATRQYTGEGRRQ
jgi:hypothetical protein